MAQNNPKISRKVAVFGAAGRTGVLVVKLAKEKGFWVTAFVRNRDNLPTNFRPDNIVDGDVLNAADVEKAVAGQDAIISVLGVVGNSEAPVVSKGVANITKAMGKHRVKRLIVQSAHGAGDSAKQIFLPVRLIMRNWLLPNPFKDKDIMEKDLLESGLDWTIVRPTRLTDDEKTEEYKTGENIATGLSPAVSRTAVAEFLVKQVTDKTYLRKSPTITRT